MDPVRKGLSSTCLSECISPRRRVDQSRTLDDRYDGESLLRQCLRAEPRTDLSFLSCESFEVETEEGTIGGSRYRETKRNETSRDLKAPRKAEDRRFLPE